MHVKNLFKSRSITMQIAKVAIVLILVFGALISAFTYFMYRQSALNSYTAKATSIAITLAGTIDPEQFAASIAGDEGDAYWSSLSQHVADISSRVDELAYLYIIVPYRGGLFAYYASSAIPGVFMEVETDAELYAGEGTSALLERRPVATGITDAGEWGTLLSAYAPIFDQNGAVLGLVGADIYADQVITATTNMTLVMIAFVLAGAVVIGLVLVRFLKRITSPIHDLDEWLQFTGRDGNITWTPEERKLLEKYANRPDEIGAIFTSYAVLVDYMQEVCDELTEVSEGRLDFDVAIRSDYDQLSKTLAKTMNDLNDMFGEINTASRQVSTGSQQIAAGAQTLAQGSAEQAATVEQLSASTAEIAQKTKINAEKASQAADLAITIKDNAEKGNRQMDEMVSAVGEISDASQSISKVIKVIDDIAFQTNILALNAAVEAARAGQHGKGFAVVADEVRSLAAKSAEAAKDTGALISNSMEKADQGVHIAQDTAESLAEIVSGINESGEIISEIATVSEAQTAGIAQINVSIDQVARIIQQNSSATEESAAASDELNGQAATLGRLINHFKLKESAGPQRGMSFTKSSESL